MKDIIIDALVDLYQNGPRSPYLGICNHVALYIDDLPLTQLSALSPTCFAEADDLMAELFQEWPEFSGSVTYPVPDPEGQVPGVAFHEADDMWSGAYGEKRWALAEFLLRKLANGAT